MTRQDHILKAARQCFARHGYAKTTMDDIAGAVGIKTGSLYHYYDGKEALFEAVITGEGGEMLDWLRRELGKLRMPEKKVLRYAQARLEYFRKATNLFDVSIQVLIEVAPLVDRLYRSFLDQEVAFLAGVIEEGIGSGDFVQCNSRDIANAILTISDAVRHRVFHAANALAASDVDYSGVEREVSYIVGLMIKGISRR